MKRFVTKASIVISSAALLCNAGRSTASTISIANPVAPAASQNFTTQGTYDWSVYDVSGSTTSNSKLGGGSISGLSTYAGAYGMYALSATSSFAPMVISYTNGTNPTTATNENGFEFAYPQAGNEGISFTATIPALITETLDVYVSSYNPSPNTTAQPGQTPENWVELTASMSGATTQANTGSLFPVSSYSGYSSDTTHGIGEYSMVVSNSASTAQVLTVYYTDNSYAPGSTSDDIGIYGVTASLTPEPASLSLVGLASLGLLSRRRRIA